MIGSNTRKLVRPDNSDPYRFDQQPNKEGSMTSKKKLGIILTVFGAVLLVASSYIKVQVEEGQKKIEGAEQTIGTGDGLFSLTEPTRAIGEHLKAPAEEKIKAGKVQIGFYTALADWMEIGGIGLVLTGTILMFLGKKKPDGR